MERTLIILTLAALAWVWGPPLFFYDPAGLGEGPREVASLDLSWGQSAQAQTVRQRFYNFQDQVFDGEVRRPTTLYTDARKQVEFEQLLTLKRSFMAELLQTSKERTFR